MEEGAENTAARRSSTPQKPYEDDIEEYSYHDEESVNNDIKNMENKGEMAVQKNNESEIEELQEQLESMESQIKEEQKKANE